MKVEVYSKTFCPFCKLAKDYLKSNGIDFDEIVLDDDAERNAMYDSFGLTGSQRTVPQVVVTWAGGVRDRVGGYNDLVRSDFPSLVFCSDADF